MVVGHRPADVVLCVALEEREEVRLLQERVIGVSVGRLKTSFTEKISEWDSRTERSGVVPLARPTQEDDEVAVVGSGERAADRGARSARSATATTGSGAGAGGSMRSAVSGGG